MSINYTKVPWDTTSYVNPTNMNRLEDGLKSACDGVDTINASLPNYDNSREILDLKMLGYTIPRECPIQNEKTSSGYVVKVGRVDLGGLSWSYDATYSLFKCEIATKKNGNNIFCNKYPTNESAVWDTSSQVKSCCGNAYTNQFCIKDTSYTDATAFRASLKGTYLYYELATPYTLSLDGAEKFNETDSLKMLGWTVPSEMPIKNYTDSNGVFHQRVGRVDLGSLSWAYNTTNVNACFMTQISSKPLSSWGTKANIYCSKYATYDWGSLLGTLDTSRKGVALGGDGVNLVISDTDYGSDATAFRTAMSDVYLYYELASEVVIKCGKEVDTLNTLVYQEYQVTTSASPYVALGNFGSVTVTKQGYRAFCVSSNCDNGYHGFAILRSWDDGEDTATMLSIQSDTYTIRVWYKKI